MNIEQEKFIQKNSPDGGFLQSDNWMEFQESTGKKTHFVSLKCFCAGCVEHQLPIIGKYFYVPRGPVFDVSCGKNDLEKGIMNLIDVAEKEGAGWVRVDIDSEEKLELLKSIDKIKIKKSPHNVQPKQIFMENISRSEEEILAGMKSKTRYNVRFAQKKGVEVEGISKDDAKAKEYFEEFWRLTEVMSKRNKITTHSKEYYQKMFKTIPSDRMNLYISRYEGKIIAAALIVFYGEIATYLHGASDDQYRNVMAPFGLHWKIMQDAKARGFKKYDFGGVDVEIDSEGKMIEKESSLQGVTRFKLGFSQTTKPLIFEGSYDIIVRTHKYELYKVIQKLKKIIECFRNLK